MTAQSEDSLVEVMARAIFLSQYAGRDALWDGADALQQKCYRDDACAALTALRAQGWAVVPTKPTETMLGVGTKARWNSAFRDANNVYEIWTAMLAAAEEGQ